MRAMTVGLWFGLAVVVVGTGCVVEETKPKKNSSSTSSGTGGPTSSSGTGGTTSSSGTGGTTSSTSSSGGDIPCLYASDCPGDDVCVCPDPNNCPTGICVLAWGRVWTFQPSFAHLPGADPATGDAWDAFGGAPDPFVEVYAGDALLGSTSVIQDTFDPSWTDPPVQAVVAGDSTDITFKMWDEDVASNDWATAFSASPSYFLGVVKSGGMYEWNDSGISLTVFVNVL